MKKRILTTLLLSSALMANAQITINIDTESNNVPISPYMYGMNGTPTNYNLVKEAGVNFIRLNDGNNLTKFNWKKQITCHPDWYGNVYNCQWNDRATKLQANLPNVQGMFAFQLLGKVAKTNEYNFNDWEYNKSQWWSGCSKKVVGGGYFDERKKAVLGDTSLYLQDWPADSTVAIYPYWRDQLGLNMDQFQYWNMDNEMEIWGSTHDDVMPGTYTNTEYEDVMQKYFKVAKAARAINPDIKLCGPNAASEWTWFNGCGNTQPTYNGKTYCWLEYFIMRCAEEQKATGIRLLDVFDIHCYPEDNTESEMLQCHRILYDKEFNYPSANGLKKINGGWDSKQTKEYIMTRCKEWIDQYFGEGNGITFGMGEYNIKNTASGMVHALSYASVIGEGSRNGMEYFTPWTWYDSMWEVVHLFSTKAQAINVGAVSSNEGMLSAYTSKNANSDSLTIILINRDTKEQAANISICHTAFQDGEYNAYTLSELPNTGVTFKGESDNAIKESLVTMNKNVIGITVPAYSITAIQLHNGTASANDVKNDSPISVYPNPASDYVVVSHKEKINKVELINMNGQIILSAEGDDTNVTINTSYIEKGAYIIRAYTDKGYQSSVLSIR